MIDLAGSEKVIMTNYMINQKFKCLKNYLITGLGGALAGWRQAEGGCQHKQVAPRPGERHQLARRGVQVHSLQKLQADKAAQGKYLRGAQLMQPLELYQIRLTNFVAQGLDWRKLPHRDDLKRLPVVAHLRRHLQHAQVRRPGQADQGDTN